MSDRLRLILGSFLMLFTELALIRWTGENVLHLSFFSNFVLLGSFLGIGLGFLWAGRFERRLYPWAPVALLVLVCFIRFFPVEVERGGSELIFFGLEATGPPRWVVLPIIFAAVATVLAFIAEGVARVFARFEPLEAYKLDIFGSIAGIVGFSVLSFLHAPPVAWGAVAAACYLATVLRRATFAHRAARVTFAVGCASLAAIVVILGVESADPDTSWSPYYKIEAPRAEGSGLTTVFVNGVFHQIHQPTDQAPGRAAYEVARPDSLDDVLVIGAGGGNDVAIALEQGAGHVDAVEIDRRIADLGKERHPDDPYSDPRVDVHVDDGRAFLERSNRDYDLILFALPDSITLVTGQSSLRLESFLFTEEAFEAARDHLKPSGVFSIYNYYREDWLADRFAGTLREVFGTTPCEDERTLFAGAPLTFFTISPDPGSVACTTENAAPWVAAGDFPEPATDDHPFPYLRDRTLPSFYVVTIGLILVASILAVRLVGGPLRGMARYLDLFFMGAAFLLLETKNVVQFALLFGTTWFVNALVFLGVLGSVLLAVLVAQRVRFRRPARLYVVLLVAIAAAYLVPQSALLDLDPVPRFLAASTLAFFPIFTANLVFADRFRDTGDSLTAFGANLLGAMVGGLIEYGALVVGYRSLLVVVAVLYALAFIFGRSHLGRDAPADAPAAPAPSVS